MTGIVRPIDLAVVSGAQRSLGWWGMVCLIATEASLFVLLLSSYVYIGAAAPEWPPRHPEIMLPLINTVILLTSSGTAWWADRRSSRSTHAALPPLLITLGLGSLFLGLQIYEYVHSEFGATADTHASLFYTITGFHGAHVFLGLLMLGATTWWIWRDLDRGEPAPLRVSLMYWHFVDVVWVFVFTLLYVVPNV